VLGIINVHRIVQIVHDTSTIKRGLANTSTAIGDRIDTSPAAMFHPPYTTDANLAGNSS
jgi:hypothetical protein